LAVVAQQLDELLPLLTVPTGGNNCFAKFAAWYIRWLMNGHIWHWFKKRRLAVVDMQIK